MYGAYLFGRNTFPLGTDDFGSGSVVLGKKSTMELTSMNLGEYFSNDNFLRNRTPSIGLEDTVQHRNNQSAISIFPPLFDLDLMECSRMFHKDTVQRRNKQSVAGL